MKKFALSLITLLSLIALISCATTPLEDGIVGVWKASNSDSYKYLAKDGTYIFEDIDEEGSHYDFGKYETNGTKIFGDFGESSIAYYEGMLIIDGKTYERVGSRMKNLSEFPLGVYKNGEDSLGISKDGLIVLKGKQNNFGTWKIDGDKLVINGKSYDYIIINKNLFIKECYSFFGTWEVVKFEKQTYGGISTTSVEKLCEKPLFFKEIEDEGLNGAMFSFRSNGTYSSYKVVDGVQYEGQETKGTYTFDNGKIKLNNGRTHVFVCIDDVNFGY